MFRVRHITPYVREGQPHGLDHVMVASGRDRFGSRSEIRGGQDVESNQRRQPLAVGGTFENAHAAVNGACGRATQSDV